jgi:DNA-binding IclR family transcriptional regulator
MSKRTDDYIVQPVMKALQVLEHVARQSHEVTLTEIVSELKLPKTTVFRYLQTLSAASFLHHDMKRDRYGIGPGFRALAKADENLQRLRDVAQPEMVGLMQMFNETVNLAVLSDRHIVYIDMVEPNRALRIRARVGDRHPVHSTSLGKAIFAFLPESRDLFQDDSLRAMTVKTLTSAKAFRRQMHDVRRRGYAIEMGENEDGLMCIGVPFFDRAGYPLAAMSLSAPERRMKPDVTVHAVEALKSAARRISVQLGARFDGSVIAPFEQALG